MSTWSNTIASHMSAITVMQALKMHLLNNYETPRHDGVYYVTKKVRFYHIFVRVKVIWIKQSRTEIAYNPAMSKIH